MLYMRDTRSIYIFFFFVRSLLSRIMRYLKAVRRVAWKTLGKRIWRTLEISGDWLLLFAGLQFGHVVDQVDVHVLDHVRLLVIGHPQLYHVVRGRRCATATAVDTFIVVVFRELLLLMLLLKLLILLLLLMVQLLLVLLMLQLLLLQLLVLLLLLDDGAVLHVLLDLRWHERSQAPRLGRRHELYATTAGSGPTSARLQHAAASARRAVLLHQIVAGLQQLLLVLQVQLVSGVVQMQRMMVMMAAVVVMVQRRLVRRRLRGSGFLTDDAHAAEVLVSQVTEVLVLVTVRADVLVTVSGFAHVPVIVSHLAAVLVVVHHFSRVDQRYSLAGQLVRVHVVHVLRHFLGHHDDDPVVFVIFGSGDFVLIFVGLWNNSTWYRVFRTAHRHREDTTNQQTMPKLFHCMRLCQLKCIYNDVVFNQLSTILYLQYCFVYE